MVLGLLILGISSVLTAGAMACRAQTGSKTERSAGAERESAEAAEKVEGEVEVEVDEVYVQG